MMVSDPNLPAKSRTIKQAFDTLSSKHESLAPGKQSKTNPSDHLI